MSPTWSDRLHTHTDECMRVEADRKHEIESMAVVECTYMYARVHTHARTSHPGPASPVLWHADQPEKHIMPSGTVRTEVTAMSTECRTVHTHRYPHTHLQLRGRHGPVHGEIDIIHQHRTAVVDACQPRRNRHHCIGGMMSLMLILLLQFSLLRDRRGRRGVGVSVGES
jgi:hypothetical protein